MEPSKGEKPWHLWVDTGGTFTDCLALSPENVLTRVKVLSSGRLRAQLVATERPNQYELRASWSPSEGFLEGTQVSLLQGNSEPRTVQSHNVEEQRITLDLPLPSLAASRFVEFSFDEEAPIVAARLATRTRFQEALPKIEMRLATTKGTNALLERKGDKTAFFVTKGFRDLLLIGNQQRPNLFDLDIQRPLPLYSDVFEVDERLDQQGNVVKSIDQEELAQIIDQISKEGFRSIAIAFLHAYRNPQNELALRDQLVKAGFSHISISSELASMIKILPRAETTVANAYLAPLMDRYIANVSSSLGNNRLQLMTSAGGLIPSDRFRPKDSLLSGPAGGVVGASVTGLEAGHDRLIAFDMGGTSTDVSRFDHHFDYQFEHRVGAAHVMAPALRIETVAAGGGSICGFSPQGLFVGPESAGANPGPACYGAGGPLTITDINLLLGRMDPDHFGIPTNMDAATQALTEVCNQIGANNREAPSETSLLAGYLEIANERMADAIGEISTREGYDPSEYTMVAFGGAGGQHACRVSERLGIRQILFPKNAGLLSAHGLRHARQEQFAEAQILQSLDEFEPFLAEKIFHLESDATNRLIEAGVEASQIEITRRILQLRLSGQEATEEIEYQPDGSVRSAFKCRYKEVFGYDTAEKPIEIVSLHVTAGTKIPSLKVTPLSAERSHPTPAKHLTPIFGTIQKPIPVYKRDDLRSQDLIVGPAIVQDDYSTVYIEANWKAIVHPNETLFLSALERDNTEIEKNSQRDRLVEEELFTHRFENLVSEMGSQLERTAVSTNVKDRLDFSCALLDSGGELIANAPHIPVHLGALGSCTRTLASQFPLKANDVIVTNHPGCGGSHLPDVTVVSPVFDQENCLVGYVANRAHHAELGGIRPGSMPPDAKNLEEEGVVIPPSYLFKEGEAQWAKIEAILTGARFPTRALNDNLADLRAQAAANLKGVHALQSLCKLYGSDTIRSQMQQLKQRASEATTAALNELQITSSSVTERLDDGTPICVRAYKDLDRLVLDFAGTGPLHPKNFNANPAIVRSAVIYVVRLLVNQPFPLNEGLLGPIEIRLPKCFLNPDFPEANHQCPAVVAGNVETSQRLVDTLIRVFELAACSQGTMNNLIFGNDRISYYETIAGGAGAGPGFNGAHAVHTHMTNTGITDPEILERRYPVFLKRFAIRADSGGQGSFSGGNGVIRELEFLEPVQLSLLTQHRLIAPYGCKGGEAGQPGKQTLIRRDGEREILPPTSSPALDKGDRLLIETPGGGGWGKAEEKPSRQDHAASE
jgi:5-oxoprolinase (ATP-hydrolysing)